MSVYIYILWIHTHVDAAVYASKMSLPVFPVIGPPNSPGPFALCGYQPCCSITRGGTSGQKNFMR